ncbi:MAG: hypothetical protein PHX70_06010 [Clostridium sp.]|nr:hypothetical protein [Clostridium sp.]
MFKINEPISIEEKGKIVIDGDLRKFEANEEEISFIQYLREKKSFYGSVVENYIKTKSILNCKPYYAYFQNLFDDNIVEYEDSYSA